MSSRVHELSVAPTLQAVARLTAALQPLMPGRLPPAQRQAIEVAVAEVLTNIVRHGYEGRGGPAIRMAWYVGDDSLVIEVRDAGRAIPRELLDAAGADSTFGFDPTDLDNLPEHGLGLGIIKTAFDHVDYGRDGGLNLLRLEKRVP